MADLYGKLNSETKLAEYTGIDSQTAETIVDSAQKTILVNVKIDSDIDINSTLPVQNSAIAEAFENTGTALGVESIDNTIKLRLVSKSGETLSEVSIDLPSAIDSGSYDANTNSLIYYIDSTEAFRISLSGLVTKLEESFVTISAFNSHVQEFDAAYAEINASIAELSSEISSKFDKTGGSIIGDVSISGDLTVSGKTTTTESETLSVKTNMIVTNSEAVPLVDPSGIAIMTGNEDDDTEAYGIAYVPSEDTVKLGLGNLDFENKFTYKTGQSQSILTRTDATSLAGSGAILWWNDTQNAASAVSYAPTIYDLVDAINSIAQKLDLTGGTMTGNLVLHHNPVLDMEAATKKYVDEHGGFKPLIVVTAPTGSTVKAIKGTTVITGVESSGVWNFDIPEYGTWTIQATKGTSSNEVSVVVDSVKQFDVEIQYYHVWGVSINQANSNPETACTYTDDAVGMTPGSSEWDTLFKYKPCLLVNGVVNKYLNPNNYAQDIDGNAVDITTVGNDVMVEFPKMGYKITTSGDTTLVQVTDNPNADGFCYKPFSRNAIGDRNYFYYGAYKSYSTENKLYSSSGKTPTSSKTRATYRSEATARGTGYFQNGFYQLIFLQCLYLLKYKNRNSQAVLGNGYVSGSAAQQTGATNTTGLNYGNTSSNTDRVKLFGIEDMWGNIWQWTDGLSTDSSRKYVVTHLPVNFDDATSGTAHTTYDSDITADLGNYLSIVQGTTDCGFAAKVTSGSATTYWVDRAYVKASCIAAFGGNWYYGAEAGIFLLNITDAASHSAVSVTSRLMYV